MEKNSKIYVAGHKGLVGSAIVRSLLSQGYTNLIVANHSALDLKKQKEVDDFFAEETPEYVFLSAAKVGGIMANDTYRAEFIYDNIMIEANVINAAYDYNVKKLLFTGSSCIYPKNAPQPILEEYLLSGELEKTNEPYAIAKIAGVKMCDAYRAQYGCNFISAMPANIFGINDKYDLQNCHVLPALVRKIITAKIRDYKTVELWGTGIARREFVYSDDVADALVFLMNNYSESGVVNIGTGRDISITELAETIKGIVDWDGEFVYNNKLDGTLRKVLSTEKINKLGWEPKTQLREGIVKTIDDIYSKKLHLNWQ